MADATVLTDNNNQTQTKIDSRPVEDASNPPVPDKYELKLPEGSLLKPEYIDQISTYAKEKGWSNERAQEELIGRSEGVKAYHDAQWKMVDDISNMWIEKGKTDTQFGGANYDKNIEIAKKEFQRFVNDELRQGVINSRIGNHPEFIRMFIKYSNFIQEKEKIIADLQENIKKLTANDTFVKGNTFTPEKQKTIAERMYPSQKKED